MQRSMMLGALVAGALLASPAAAEWPDKPITMIVPYGAGGVTDQVIRVVAQELDPVLGQEIVVVNQPGASGSIGTRAVMDAPKDGYTWLSGGVRDIGTYAVVGMLDTKLEDWHAFVVASIGAVLSVNDDRPWQDVPAFLDALKATPGQIRVATAGINSSGGQALGAISTTAGVEAEQVVYDGGNPAVLATVSGETDATTQLSLEQAEMIRAGRLRALAFIGSTAMELDGIGTIPPITNWLPDLPSTENFVGVYLPEGVPAEVVAKLASVWGETLANSEALQKLCATRGCGLRPMVGDEAMTAAQPLVRTAAWGLFERNEHKVSPEELGIPKP